MPAVEYSVTVQTILRGDRVNAAVLMTLAFSTETIRLWSGQGVSPAGYEGERIVSLTGLEDAIGTSAPSGSVVLSGLDDRFINAALNGPEQVAGRDITIALQFYDDNFAALDTPDVLLVGKMGLPTIRGDVAQRTVEIPFERDTSRRAIAPFGNWSDRDQKRLYPGDEGFEFMPTVRPKTVKLTPI